MFFVGNPLLNQLSDTAAHYIVPDIGVICDYLEVLELPELTSIVITQTVMHHVSKILYVLYVSYNLMKSKQS